jgi:hypothetical protein
VSRTRYPSSLSITVSANFEAEQEVTRMLDRFLQMNDGTKTPEADPMASYVKAYPAVVPLQQKVV